MGIDVSVVLTTYNQPVADILTSCASVLLQRDVEVELIVSDDASLDNRFPLIDKFITSQFPKARYRLIRHDQNQKTVLNLYDGLKHANGLFSKELGAGDLLYDYETLKAITEFATNNGNQPVFGKVVTFREDESNAIIVSDFDAPKNEIFYGSEVPPIQQAMKMVSLADWIPGSAQLYLTGLYQELLYKLASEYQVLYCEDFSAVLSLFERGFTYFDQPLIWYKFGDGISASGSLSSRKRMYEDHANFYNNLRNSPLSHFPEFNQSVRLFKLRRMFALHTPIAGLLQHMVAASYQTNTTSDLHLTPLFQEARDRVDFFLSR